MFLSVTLREEYEEWKWAFIDADQLIKKEENLSLSLSPVTLYLSLSLCPPVRSADPDFIEEEEDYSGLPSETIRSSVCEWNVLGLTGRLLASNWKLPLGLCSMCDSSDCCRHTNQRRLEISTSKLIPSRFKAPCSSVFTCILWLGVMSDLCDADKCSYKDSRTSSVLFLCHSDTHSVLSLVVQTGPALGPCHGCKWRWILSNHLLVAVSGHVLSMLGQKRSAFHLKCHLLSQPMRQCRCRK